MTTSNTSLQTRFTETIHHQDKQSNNQKVRHIFNTSTSVPSTINDGHHQMNTSNLSIATPKGGVNNYNNTSFEAPYKPSPSYKLSPIKNPLSPITKTSSPTHFPSTYNGSGPNGLASPMLTSFTSPFNEKEENSPSMITALTQTKSAKKQIEKEYTSLMNRIKFLEEEERRNLSRLQQFDFLSQKHEDCQKLKGNNQELAMKRKELELKDIQGKVQLVAAVKVWFLSKIFY